MSPTISSSVSGISNFSKHTPHVSLTVKFGSLVAEMFPLKYSIAITYVLFMSSSSFRPPGKTLDLSKSTGIELVT